MKSKELNQDADEIKKKTTYDDVFHKSPDELVLIKTEVAEDNKLDAELSDPLGGAKGEDQVKEIHQNFFDLIEAAKLFDPGIKEDSIDVSKKSDPVDENVPQETDVKPTDDQSEESQSKPQEEKVFKTKEVSKPFDADAIETGLAKDAEDQTEAKLHSEI